MGQVESSAIIFGGSVIPIGALATGTPDGTKFIRDDGTLQTPPGGGGPASQLDANGTTLDVDAITDGQYLRRVGTTIVSGTPSGGGNTAYAPGSVTVATGNFALHVKRLELTTTQRLTLAGTARFRLSN